MIAVPGRRPTVALFQHRDGVCEQPWRLPSIRCISSVAVSLMSPIAVADRIGVGSLDRAPQTLPIPLGGLAPAHRHTGALRRGLRRHRTTPLLAIGLAASTIGVLLSAGSPAFEVGIDAAGLHIDGMTLSPIAESAPGSRIFSGAATIAITTAPDAVRAGSVMTWNGFLATGRCVLRRSSGGATETCVYSIGTRRLTSVDRFVDRTDTWSRHYTDGVDISIGVSAAATLIPLPFPFGR
jgi:hypothetical protein